MAKSTQTGTSHALPFEKLSAPDFERLCLSLVTREGYERASPLGEAGSRGERDLVAWREGRRAAFRCRRVQALAAADALAEIKKLRRLPAAERPRELVFVVTRPVADKVRRAARTAWGDEESCHFWAGNDLGALVKRHPVLLAELFPGAVAGRFGAFRHNLPFPALGPLFHGREAMLERLHETLGRTPSGYAVAIAGQAGQGPAGVGTTRLAVEYAWRHAADYSAVFFARAGSTATLRRDVAALCAPEWLDLPEHDSRHELVEATAAMTRLEKEAGWLLILDDVDVKETAAFVGVLTALFRYGHVLLVGRLADWGPMVEAIPLDPLTEEAAAGFLLARTDGHRRTTPKDDAHATALARELGGNPLALELAGALIAGRELSLSGYLDGWTKRRDEVRAWFDVGESPHLLSCAATWQASVDCLSIPARRLLERLAWLGPEPIPESLLDVPVPGLAEAAERRDALAELAACSLVTRGAAKSPNFLLHSIIQEVTRRSLANGPGQGALLDALAWMDAAFAGEPRNPRTWPVLLPLAPHVRSLAGFADAAGIATPTTRLMGDLAQVYEARSMQEEAEPLLRRVLAITEASLGPDHVDFAMALNNLAMALQAMQHFAEAEPLMRRAVAISEAGYGPDHPEFGTALNNLATLLYNAKRYTEAEPLMRRHLHIFINFERRTGKIHPYLRAAFHNYTHLLQKLGRSEAQIKAEVTEMLGIGR